jgi:D-alanyl-D-alanine carboxypeptidase/D-alanyl-D-alanine-endopeptidase (penicillin-binding protein 4)
MLSRGAVSSMLRAKAPWGGTVRRTEVTNRIARHAFRRVALVALLAALIAAPAVARAPGSAPLPAPRPALIAAAQSASLVVRAPARPAAATAAAPQGAAPAFIGDALVTEAGLTGHVGFVLIDMATGEVLDARHPDGPFPPASTAKAITAVYALETLGPEHRFVTELRADGPIRGGTISGALALVGGGDPDLDTDDLADLMDQAARAGLKKVTGVLTVDGRALPSVVRIDPEQPEHVAYNPSVGGLNLNYNRALFEWRKAKGGHDLSVRAAARRNGPAISAVTVALGAPGSAVFTALGDQGGAEAWTVAPGALGKDGGRWLPVRRPDIYAGDSLRALGAARGVTLPAPRAGRAPDDMIVIARHESPPLRDIIRGMLRWSTNLTAEALGMAASGPVARDLDQSSDRMTTWMVRRAGLAMRTGPSLRNHSGLSAESRITPMQMATFLRAAALGTTSTATPTATGWPGVFTNPGSLVALAGAAPGGGRPAAYVAPGVAAGARSDADLPRGDLHGLLREVALGSGKDAPPKGVRAVAKTGTLLFVRGLVGYLDAASGRRLTFAIYAEDLGRRSGLEDLESDRRASGWSSRARAMERRLLNAWARRF